MSIQMTVRLADVNAAYVDELVATGQARSRADVLNSALDRQRRAAIAANDVQIYARLANRESGEDDLLEFSQFTARTPLDID